MARLVPARRALHFLRFRKDVDGRDALVHDASRERGADRYPYSGIIGCVGGVAEWRQRAAISTRICPDPGTLMSSACFITVR